MTPQGPGAPPILSQLLAGSGIEDEIAGRLIWVNHGAGCERGDGFEDQRLSPSLMTEVTTRAAEIAADAMKVVVTRKPVSASAWTMSNRSSPCSDPVVCRR